MKNCGDTLSKYQLIANEMRARINQGVYDESEPLPDEMTLCEEFQVSRMTMKKALEQLVLDGLVYRKRGHGTFIMKSNLQDGRLNLANRNLKGLTASVKNGKVESTVVCFEIVFADETIRHNLDLPEDSLVYKIIRARSINGEPYVVEYTYMPVTVIPGLNQAVLYDSIYTYIEQSLELTIGSARKIIRADKPNELDKKYLNCQDTDPVLEVEQVGYLHNGIAFEYSFSRHRFDKFEFTSFSVRR